MGKIIFILLFLGLFSSCAYKVLTDGKLDHREDWVRGYKNPRADSILVFDEYDTIPRGCVFINNTTLITRPNYPGDELYEWQMFKLAGKQANRAGANVIKITDREWRKGNRFVMVAQMYSLKEPYFADYINRVNAANLLLSDSLRNLPVQYRAPYYLANYNPLIDSLDREYSKATTEQTKKALSNELFSACCQGILYALMYAAIKK